MADKMEQKKYMDIKRLNDKFILGIQKGDHIIVQEKIDGANFSIQYDETEGIRAFGRNHPLDAKNTLRGAWEWSRELDQELVKTVLGTNLILFGEWLTPHTVVYPRERYHNAYFYDVWDSTEEQYLDQNRVEAIVRQLGLLYVPVFYKGEFISWEHLKQFVGKTALGGKLGEGIVIKNMTRLNALDSNLPFYTKVVCDQFAEKISVKKFDGNKVDRRVRQQAIVESVVTPGRVAKLVNKMVDEGIIPENWAAQDIAIIAKNMGRAVYQDCMKEESGTVEEVGKLFGMLANARAMEIVRAMAANQGGQ